MPGTFSAHRPSGDGHRFFADDLGDGVPCGAERRDAYVGAFARFANRRTRFRWIWLIGVVVCLVAALPIGTVRLERPPAIALLDRDNDLLPVPGAGLTVLPLASAFRQGYRLSRSPVLGHGSDTGSIRRRQLARTVFDRRVRGLSNTLIGLLDRLRRPAVVNVGRTSPRRGTASLRRDERHPAAVVKRPLPRSTAASHARVLVFGGRDRLRYLAWIHCETRKR